MTKLASASGQSGSRCVPLAMRPLTGPFLRLIQEILRWNDYSWKLAISELMAVLFTFHLPLQVAYSDPPGLFPDASRCSFRSRSGSLLLMLAKGVSLFLVAVPNSVPPLRRVPLFNSSVLSLTMPSASFYFLANETKKKICITTWMWKRTSVTEVKHSFSPWVRRGTIFL